MFISKQNFYSFKQTELMLTIQILPPKPAKNSLKSVPFHTHAIAGILGGVLTGFSVPKLRRLFYIVPDWEKYIGLAYGLQNGRTSAGFKQMGIRFTGIIFVISL
ncbi:hypothetical protein SLE2022_128720 [Rubroshorea leprosula]